MMKKNFYMCAFYMVLGTLMFSSISYGVRDDGMDSELENRVQRALIIFEEGLVALKEPTARALSVKVIQEDLTHRNEGLRRTIRHELETKLKDVNKEINSIMMSATYMEELRRVKGNHEEEVRLYKRFVGPLIMQANEIEEAVMGRHLTGMMELNSLLEGLSGLVAKFNLQDKRDVRPS